MDGQEEKQPKVQPIDRKENFVFQILKAPLPDRDRLSEEARKALELHIDDIANNIGDENSEYINAYFKGETPRNAERLDRIYQVVRKNPSYMATLGLFAPHPKDSLAREAWETTCNWDLIQKILPKNHDKEGLTVNKTPQTLGDLFEERDNDLAHAAIQLVAAKNHKYNSPMEMPVLRFATMIKQNDLDGMNMDIKEGLIGKLRSILPQ
jgi:transcriptional regulator with XRE-family HTH domain